MERKTSDPVINNEFYDLLHEKWYEADNHPIALLRAENLARNPWIEQTIEDQLGRNKTILDLGCGAGLLANSLALKGHDVTGIDLSMNSLREAELRDATRSVKYMFRAVEKLPFDEACFDVVCAMDLLEHVQDPHQVIKEASRVLKPGGLFFFHTFNRNFLSWLIVIKGVEWFVSNTPKNMHLYAHFVKPAELVQYCLKEGLKPEMMQGLTPDLAHRSFWKSFFTRTIAKDFRFIFTRSLKTGYVGFAKRVSSDKGAEKARRYKFSSGRL